MTRWKASALHLAISILVLGTIAALLVWRWYPPALFHMAKADKLLMLVAMIDLIVGPLLTLIVYKQGKKTLRFDLTVIALIQATAMGYGLYTMWQSRPVYLVASGRYFDLVFANEIDRDQLLRAPPKYRELPTTGARMVGILVPTDQKERERAMDLALAGSDMQFVPSFYKPYAAVIPVTLAKAISIDRWLANVPAADREAIEAAIHTTGKTADKLALVPVYSSRGGAALLLDARNGRVLKPLSVELSLDAMDSSTP
jgi:hypothetical protein